MNTKVKGINLLPNEYIVAQKVNFYEKIIGAIVVAEVACFVAFVALPPKNEVKRTQRELQDKQLELSSEKYAGVNKTLNELEETKNAIQSWINSYGKIKLDGYIREEVLDELVSRVPAGVFIEKINIDDSGSVNGNAEKKISLSGSCDKNEEARGYITILETLFPAEQIESSITVKETGGAIFNITITVKPEEPATQGNTEGEGGDTAAAGEASSEPVDTGEGAN